MATPAENRSNALSQSGDPLAAFESGASLGDGVGKAASVSESPQHLSQGADLAVSASANIAQADFVAGIEEQRQTGAGTHVIVKPDAATADQVREIGRELVTKALASGLSLPSIQFDWAELGGGNATDIVGRADLHVPLLLKVDRHENLVKEAKFIRSVRANEDLPERYRNAWASVYAIRDKRPYAYLSQFFPATDGWVSLEDRLFGRGGAAISVNEAVGHMNTVLDVIFEGVEATINRRMPPSVRSDYIGRIRDRLSAAERASPVFQSRTLSINGESCPPWKDTLAWIDTFDINLEALAPPFSSIVHGDPNPGNLLIRDTGSITDVKLIDPKPWGSGDYLFDIAKITHFLEATGPIERSLTWVSPEQADPNALLNTDTLHYAFNRHAATDALVKACLERVARFADAHGDKHWRERYDLAMAANILGLPANRFGHPTKPKPLAAVALYAEGLLWLKKFRRHLRGPV